MNNLNINQVSKQFQISLRTLRYYDEIGLLKPIRNKINAYRVYSYEDKIKLQQILFLKQSGVDLKTILELFNSDQQTLLKALQNSQKIIESKIINYKKNLKSLNKTINFLTQSQMSNQLYPDKTPKEINQIRQESISRWGDKVIESEKKLSRLPQKDLESLIQQGKKIAIDISNQMLNGKSFKSPETQAKIEKYFQYMQNFYECTPQIFQGLAEMYVSDQRFTKYYEDIKPNLASYISQAMIYFVQNNK